MFQFHFGTIDSLIRCLGLTGLFCFNSTLVRLIVIKLKIGTKELMFQFHFGTIDRLNHTNSVAASNLFQFHFGTIDSTLQGCKVEG